MYLFPHLYATDFKLLSKGLQALDGVGVVVVLRSKDRHHKGLGEMGPHTAGLCEHLEFSHFQQNNLRIDIRLDLNNIFFPNIELDLWTF